MRPSSRPISDGQGRAAVLRLEGVIAGYDDVVCLHGVSLGVRRGEIVTLIGANGAGKSTTLKTISGLLRCRAGTIELDGRSIAGLPPDAIVALGLVQVPEGRRVFTELSVEDNLRAGAYLVRERACVRETMHQVFDRFPRLAERRKQLGGTLSGGEQQMLAFGRAMMARPRLLMLDEPSLGLAPLMVEEVMRAIRMFRGSGMTVLLVEQNANLALRIADRAYLMEMGAITMADTATRLLADEHVRTSYLGAKPQSRGEAVVTRAQAGQDRA
jgi:branched-chain amino acid transport system ATP-binding protein